MAEATKNCFTQYDFISEGDSPAFFYLIDVGLRSLEDGSYGGWGGRMLKSAKNPFRWEDGKNVTDFNPYTKKNDAAYPQVRWVDVLQNDFAARADWCVKDYKDANHAPVVKSGSMDYTARPKEVVKLSGNATDPDGDQLSYRWWQYEEVGTYKGRVTIGNPLAGNTSVTIPDDIQKGQTVHIILEVSDSGKPKLTRYQRVIITGR